MIYKRNKVCTLFVCLITTVLIAQNKPTFLKGQDMDLSSKKWKLVKSMSDEFKKEKLNKRKWHTNTGWIGRAPALFDEKTIKVEDGFLKITNYKLSEPVEKKGKEYTHAGGLVASTSSRTYGYYECKMKASKTFMSSTFWLINQRGEGQGCDKRTTELDVQECVGRITGSGKWMQDKDQIMGSNTHSRAIPEGCNIVKKSKGAKVVLKDKAYKDFHVYGVWWKNEKEVYFFLDGKFVNKVTPASDFDLPMYLRLVTETYNWNPVPEDGGLLGSKEERTTTYDWVRSWRMKK